MTDSAGQEWLSLYNLVMKVNKTHLLSIFIFKRTILIHSNKNMLKGHAGTGGMFCSKVTHFAGGVWNSTIPTKPLSPKYGMSQASHITSKSYTHTQHVNRWLLRLVHMLFFHIHRYFLSKLSKTLKFQCFLTGACCDITHSHEFKHCRFFPVTFRMRLRFLHFCIPSFTI